MPRHDRLIHYYSAYTAHKLTLKETCDKIIEYIFLHPSIFAQNLLTQETRSRILLHLCENMPNLIRRYDPSRSSFITYLDRCMQYSCALDHRAITKKQRCEYVLYPTLYYEMQLLEEDAPLYSTAETIENIDSTRCLHVRKLSKRYQTALLIFVLKHITVPEKTAVNRLVQLTDYTEDQIYSAIYSVREQNEARIRRLYHTYQMHVRVYALRLIACNELQNTPKDTKQYLDTARMLQHNTARMHKTLQNIQQFKKNASDISIMRTLHIPSRRVLHIYLELIHSGRLQKAIDQIYQSTL